MAWYKGKISFLLGQEDPPLLMFGQTLVNSAKSKGTWFETAVVNYLRANGFPRVYRPAPGGALDKGDIHGIMQGLGRKVIIQCKNQKAFNLSGWLNDTVEQALNVGEGTVPILVVKRPKVGEKTLGETYVVMCLEDFVGILRDGNYS